MNHVSHTNRLGTLEFWNLILATTLLYGGLVVLVALLTDRATHTIVVLHHLNATGLAMMILGGGTAGLHVLRRMLLRRGQWRPALTFAVSVQGALTLVALATGNTALVPVFLLLAGVHILTSRVLKRV